ncbi:hypothetical protein MWN52_15175 [Pseudoxanthomonas winnipegensis]|uniref:hypothetical protein n=1 Tax=Pseudoxanthomonas winnipegensis TaxID=2480810 RepID=UPI0025777D37|nr:hypothetical protein [Pseudoxanthomonas winnipegensis]WJI14952.1 hypothetical protein MWN52_15175 [Pseudoxanthomonas winnipegensis]
MTSIPRADAGATRAPESTSNKQVFSKEQIEQMAREVAAEEEAKEQRYQRIRLVDQADELIFKARAVLSALQYGRREIDDDGETIDGVTWVVRDHLSRLKEIVNQMVDLKPKESQEVTP